MNPKRFGWLLIIACGGAAAAVLWHHAPQAAGQLRSDRAPSAEQQTLAPGQIDTQQSRVYAYVGKTGLGHEHGIVGRVKEGEVHLGAARQAGRVVFDMASFLADTPEARRYVGLPGETSAATQQRVTANMLGRDVLDVRRFPTATFTIMSAVPLGQKSRRGHPLYQFNGQFTLHGVTRPLSLVAEAIDQGGRVRLRGGFSIRQTHFGITPYTKAFGAVGVADQLTIYGEIYVVKPS